MANRTLWAVNRLTSLLPTASLDLENLLQTASKHEGEADFGDPNFKEGLGVLVRSLEHDARLSPMGRRAIQGLIVRSLITRLRLVADQRARPDVYARPLLAPILILGMPRAGTTFLHRLLSVMPDVRPARTWELNQPLPPTQGKDDRLEQASRQVAMIRKLLPELDGKHRLAADEPDECVLLMNPSFCSIAWWMFAPVYGYIEWLREQDLAPAYREYHGLLHSLQATQSGRLVLKAPAHTGYLAELVAEIPELIVVQAHRDPVTVLASASSLFNSMFKLVTEHHDVERTARQNLELFVSLNQRCQDARDGGLDDRVLDLHYDTLIADPIAAVRRIYAHGSIPWPEGGEAALRAHLEVSRRGRSKHSYSLEECGLSDAEVSERFASYSARHLRA